MSDKNPIFIDFDRDKGVDLVDNAVLRESNSPNHRGRGQNVLYRDGSVRFIQHRRLGPNRDDIYTIQRTVRYLQPADGQQQKG